MSTSRAIRPKPFAEAQGATRRIARHAASLQFDDLSPEMVTLTKKCVLDTLGVIIGASGMAPEGRIARDYVMDQGGKPESSILGFGGKTTAPLAAFVNGGLGHMMDYDDVSAGHVSIATIPVALALGERMGGLSGRELITAIAVTVVLFYFCPASLTLAALGIVGLTTLLGVQAFIIIGGVIRVVPLTGITLPFVSYGGSSLVANYVLLALLMRVSDSTSRRIGELPDDPTIAERYAAWQLRRTLGKTSAS